MRCRNDKRVRFAISDVTLHFIQANFPQSFSILVCHLVRSVHVYIHDVLRNHLHVSLRQKLNVNNTHELSYLVSGFVVFIFDDEDHVKTRQDCGLEVNILDR